MTTETESAEELGPCVHLLNHPCCDPFALEEHHRMAPADCVCDRKHHLVLEPVRCGLDAVWHGEHAEAPAHAFEAEGAIRG